MSYGAVLYLSGIGVGLLIGAMIAIAAHALTTQRRRRHDTNEPPRQPASDRDVVAVAEAIVRDAARKGEIQ